MSHVIEVDYKNLFKNGNRIGGDVFLQTKSKDTNRIVCSLSDGLGSGVKANVLANLTATMGHRFVLNNMDIRDSAHIIMDTLPVCNERKISYATFTILDVSEDGMVDIIEYDNPDFILMREDNVIECDKKKIELKRQFTHREEKILYSKIQMKHGDRLIVFSDGVTQSGIGTKRYPLGWRQNNVEKYIIKLVKEKPDISARELSKRIVDQGCYNDGYSPKDDITCAVLYYRRARDTLVVSGPPFSKKQDNEVAQMVKNFNGKCVLSGGTTSEIIGRELNRMIKVDLKNFDPKIPPPAIMEGIDLVTEGMLTLNTVADLLEKGISNLNGRKNAAVRMVELLMDSDRVNFIVGTTINAAHQDPEMPVDMGIRRTIIKRIVKLLEDKYLKKVNVKYV